MCSERCGGLFIVAGKENQISEIGFDSQMDIFWAWPDDQIYLPVRKSNWISRGNAFGRTRTLFDGSRFQMEDGASTSYVHASI
jgi:hypothetical protein